MNAPAQLSMFEPEGAEAMQLLQKHLREAEHHLSMADRFELLGMAGAVRRAEAQADDATSSALVLALLLDIEREAGL